MKTIKTDLTSKVFGRLRVISYEGRNKQYDSLWKCLCECGNYKIVRGGVLKNSHTQSCGCLQRERAAKVKTTHGLIKENYKLYKVWIGIKQRCNNKRSKSFPDYGARGVKVFSLWEKSFPEFHKWAIENGYREGLTIERENVYGNYEPCNCTWIVKSEQSKNRTSSVLITHDEKTLTASEWSQKTGIPSKIITQRIRRGWSSEKTLTTNI